MIILESFWDNLKWKSYNVMILYLFYAGNFVAVTRYYQNYKSESGHMISIAYTVGLWSSDQSYGSSHV